MEAVLKTTNNQAPSVESLAAWLLASGESMPEAARNRRMKTEPAAPIVGDTFRKLVEEITADGTGMDKVASRAGVHWTSISRQYSRSDLTKTIKRVCAAFGYNAKALERGEISKTALTQPAAASDEIAAMVAGLSEEKRAEVKRYILFIKQS